MKGIAVPERNEDFTADPVELFFDLSYVLAFSQIVGQLVHHPDWAGVGKAALLFGLMWLPWSQFTWSANAVAGNGRAVRALFLVATAISVPMAASVSTAYGPGGPTFAICLGLIYVLAAAMMLLGVGRTSVVGRSITRFAGTSLVAIVMLVAGSFLEDGARVAAWLAAAAITVTGMVLAGRREWIIRTGHFAERHGLIVIIALGEVIVAIGIPVVSSLEGGEGLPAPTLVALVAAGSFASLLWWAYFDRVGPALEHRGEEVVGDIERGRYARDVYTAAHAPVVAGIIVAAAALEEIALHPEDPVATSFRVMLAAGLALTVAGVGLAIWRAFGVVARERVVAGAAIAVVLVAGSSWPGVVLLVVVDAIILAALAAEHLRIER